MGTRNVTIIISGGETKVRQYGQWDGYPTTALASIRDVLQNKTLLERLKENVEKCHLVPENRELFWSECALGRKAETLFDELCDFRYKPEHKKHYEFDSEAEWMLYIMSCGYSFDDVLSYMLCTRDTGYKIVEVLASFTFGPQSIPMQDCGMDDTDWQIEAVNVVDLDAEELRCNWHGKRQTFLFNALPTEEEIEEFEKEDD